MRGLANVNAEMEFWMLGYNLKRVLSILGLEKFRAYCLERIEKRLQIAGLSSFFWVYKGSR